MQQISMPVSNNTSDGNSQVTVILLTYNSVSKLGLYFDSVLLSVFSQEYPNLRLLVVDNNSKDDTIKHIKEKILNCEILPLDSNLGWGGGNNIGALLARKSRFLFFMNDDVILQRNCVAILADLLEKNKEIAAVQPLIKNKDGSINCGADISFTGLPRPVNFENKALLDVFYASGAALLVRTLPFFEVGMFDKDLFLWRDDVDLCWRLRLAGYKIFCNTNAEAYHYVSASLGLNNPILTYYLIRNNIWLLTKLCKFKYLIIKLALFMIEISVDFIGTLLAKKKIGIYIVAIVDGLLGMGKMMLKRRTIVKNISENQLNNRTKKEIDIKALFPYLK